MILIFNSTTIINVLTSKKLNYRQTRLYRIIELDPLKEIYRVSELDGVVFRDMYAGNRLKRFYVIIIFDVSSRYGTPAPSNSGDNIVNFVNAF